MDNLETPKEENPFLNGEAPAPAPTVNAEPVKRRPGRPRKDGSQSAPVNPVDPNSAAKKRGRPPKRETITTEQKAVLGQQLAGLHAIAAHLSGMPELMLTEQESVMLADAVLAVSVEYGLSVTGKTGAAIQLLGAAAVIYLPRLVAVKNRVAAQKKGLQDAAAPTVN